MKAADDPIQSGVQQPPPASASTKKLPVSAVLFGILAGIVGAAAGLAIGLAFGSMLASALHVSPMEGGAGYFVVSIALLVCVIATPMSILLVLYWGGVRRIWLLVGLFVVCVGMIAVGGSGFGVWYMAQPHIPNTNGPTPLLEFEVRPPDGQSLEMLTNVEAELGTDRNTMPASWHDQPGEDPRAKAGYVEIYFRTSQRLFILKFPGNDDRIYKLRLPANPMKAKYRAWSAWQKPDFVAKGNDQPSRASGGADYEIRYKIDYQDR